MPNSRTKSVGYMLFYFIFTLSVITTLVPHCGSYTRKGYFTFKTPTIQFQLLFV
jgi:hypothetical protein